MWSKLFGKCGNGVKASEDDNNKLVFSTDRKLAFAWGVKVEVKGNSTQRNKKTFYNQSRLKSQEPIKHI